MPRAIADYLRRGVELWAEGGRLRYRMRPGLDGASMLEELAGRKQALLAELASSPDGARWHPLTDNQEALFLHQALWPDDPAYNVGVALRFDDDPGGACVERALADLCRAHPSLLRVYRRVDAAVYQRAPHGAARIALEELWFDDEAAAAQAAAAFERTPFALDGILSRARLHRLRTAAGATLQLSLHHLNVDFWSLGLIVRDLRAALMRSLPARAGADRYLDHVRDGLLRPATDAQLARWRQRIAEKHRPFALPAADPGARTGCAADAGAGVARSAAFSIHGARRAALAAAAKRQGTTDFVIVLAAYLLVLARLSGTDRPSACIPTLGRTAEQRDVVGYFANPLPVFADLRAAATADALIDAVKLEVAEALDADGVPYAWIVGQARHAAGGEPQTGGGEPQTFPAFLNWNALPPAAVWDDSRSVGLSQVGGFCRSMLTVTDVAGEYRADWTCDAPAAPFARLWTDHLIRTIDWLADAAGGGRLLDDRPRAGPADSALIGRANDTDARYEAARPLAAVIAERCAAHPDATAVRFRGADMTYAALDRRAAAMAAALHARGVAPGDFVGLCMDRCDAMIVALLGILRAGAAFVPLDPSWPAERLRHMIGDAGLPLVVTDAAAGAHPGLRGQARLDMAGVAEPSDAPAAALATAPPSDPDAPAYMLFTSGSTGRPKGVVVDHRAVYNRLFWMQSAYPLRPGDRVLQKTPATFDVSVWEFFWPLMFGATLVVAEPESHKDPERLARAIAMEGITHIHFVPSMLSLFLDYPAGPPSPALRHVFCSGEALPPATVGAFFDRYPDVRLHNLYGPTEAAIDVSVYECRPADRRRAGIPIGRPVANTRLHVLDAAFRPLPVGVEGELFIEGVQLARGYHGRPELTAERFPSVDLPGLPGAGARRLYRTGDIARWNPDGELEYAGRADDQVKIRGQRVELGEIAAVLGEHPSVRLAACALRTGPSPSILAAVVLADAAAAADAEPANDIAAVLRDHLLARLPTHMIPAAITAVPRLPITGNGKLDRAAMIALCLPSPPPAAAAADAEPVLPELLSAWRRALGADAPAGRDADFFLAGGDSIKSVRLIGDLAEAGWSMDARRLHGAPTLGALDGWLRAAVRSDAPALRGPAPRFALLAPEDRTGLAAGCEDSYPLTALQEVMHGHTEARRGLPIYHDVFTVRLTRPIDPSALRDAMRSAVDAHPALRTRLRADSRGGFVQDVLTHAPADFASAAPPAGQSFEAALALLVEAQQAAAFDFEHGALLRLRHLASGAEAALVLSFHHLILDGWSVASLIRQLLAAAAGGPPPAAAGAYRFADYVALERAEAADQGHRAHWAKRLSNAPATLVGPAAPAPDRRGGMARAAVPLPPEAERRLRDRAHAWGVPLKAMCMALHCRALMAFLDRDVVTTSYVVDGRLEVPGYESVLGLHLNTVPLVARHDGDAAAFVRGLRAQEIDNLPHRRFPLLDMLRDARTQRPFNTVFNFTDFHVYKADPATMGLVADISVREFTDYDLVGGFSIHPGTGRLAIQVDHRVGVLDAPALDRLLAGYALALQELTAATPPDAGPMDARRRNPALAEACLRLVAALPAAAALPEVERATFDGVDGRGRMAVSVVPTPAALPQHHHRPAAGLLRHRLADGIEVACLNRTETDFNHREVFTEGMLARFSLGLPEDALVFDVGANIGLFTLFLHGLHPAARIYAFEPAPDPFAALVDNMAAYRVRGDAMPLALGARQGRATLTYYPANTLISGFHADDGDYEATWRALVNARPAARLPDAHLPDEAGLRAMLSEKLERRQLAVEVSTVSRELRALALPTIDLLKVDVEKAELDVLHGIDEPDWPRIGAVLLEVHDIDRRVETARRMLERHGFICHVEQDRGLRGTDIHGLLATRRPLRPVSAGAARPWRYAEAGVAAAATRAIRDASGLAPEQWSLRLARPGEAAGREHGAPCAAAPPFRPDDLSLFQAVWAKLLGDRPFAPELSFYEQGVDSITLLRLLRGVNAAFGCSIPVAGVSADLTASALLALRAGGPVAVTDRSRVPGAPTLVLIVPFGASPDAYRALAAALERDHTIRMVALSDEAYLGRDLRAAAHDHWAALRPALIGADLLVGWSLGGNLALALSDRWRIDTGKSLPVALLDSHVRDDNPGDGAAPAGAAGARPGADDPLRLLRLETEALIGRGLFIAAAVAAADRLPGARPSRAFLADAVERSVAADHFSMLKEPHATRVAAIIASYCRGGEGARP